MKQSSTIKVGKYEIAVTTSLRELFSRTHAVMSGSDPTSKQFPPDEQYEMYLACEVVDRQDRSRLNMEKTEENLLELIHYLNVSGVNIPDITGRVRCFGALTRAVAMRFHVDEVRRRETQKVIQPQFLEPAYA